MTIEDGMNVKVTDWGRGYTTNTPWFTNNWENLEKSWIINYAYGNEDKFNNSRYDDPQLYKVLYTDGDKALIGVIYNSYVHETYLIGVDGIAPIRKMTLQQIEEELGYSIELVEEEDV